MERTHPVAHRRRLILFCAAAAATAFLLRDVLRALGMQVLAASVLMLLALPLCRHLERKAPAGAAAALSLTIVLLGMAALLIALVPMLLRQLEALVTSLPALTESLREPLTRLSQWLSRRQIDLTPFRDSVMSKLTDAAGNLVSRVVGMVSGVLSGLSKVLLSPLLAFYLLRDRRKIAAGLTLVLPVSCRARGVRAAREMKRESAAYLRGQLLLSLIVGGMTALGMLILGIPGWLLLGVLMGVMELVPYIGPVIAGIPAVLLALQGGWIRALWTAALLLLIQETEGAFLSPRLVGHATALHPMVVLLMVSAGGLIAGPVGMVTAIPLAVSLRGAIRGWRE